MDNLRPGDYDEVRSRPCGECGGRWISGGAADWFGRVYCENGCQGGFTRRGDNLYIEQAGQESLVNVTH